MIPHKIIKWHKSLPPLVPVRYADWLRRTPANLYASAVNVVVRGMMINANAIQAKRTHRNELIFFQAEDGIRDVERSRGLGDVYKRQQLLLCIIKLTVVIYKHP